MATDYYELLGVARNASEDELKRAYRQLARELHPDANGGNPESEARFKEVTVAYETLRDPERRRRYDMFGPEAARNGAGGPGDVFGAGLGDLFDAFFGGAGFGQQRQQARRTGDDLEVAVELAFEEAIFGASRPVQFRGVVVCATCSGSGAAPGTSPITCLECAGVGQVRRVRQSILGQVVTTAACPRCRGFGQVIEHPCPDCRGEGRRMDDRSVEVEIPAGVDDGTTLRVPGGGAPAPRGGPAGDLFVRLRVRPHERFERAGSDLVTTVHLAMTQAALGVELDVETLDGLQHLTVPAGTESGRVLRLRGLGVPHLRARGRGDLHVNFVVDTPTQLSKEQEQLLRELAGLREEAVSAPEEGLLSRIRSSLS